MHNSNHISSCLLQRVYILLSSGGKLPRIQGLVVSEVSFVNGDSITILICSLFHHFIFCCFVICIVKGTVTFEFIKGLLLHMNAARFNIHVFMLHFEVFLWINNFFFLFQMLFSAYVFLHCILL